MHPACEACKGACCEQVLLPIDATDTRLMEYFNARGTLSDAPGYPIVILDSRCPELTDEGRCGCHHMRPQVCEQYPVGGRGCLAAIKRRRPNQAASLTALATTGA